MTVLSGQGIQISLVIGLIAGWLAGKVVRGAGFGLIGNIIVGIVGAFVGSWLWTSFHLAPMGGPTVNAILVSMIGAIVLLVLIRLIRRA
jgi:uncharacterized membrane protein YeaQ/YmgE (transglycosylase-associated protein family)